MTATAAVKLLSSCCQAAIRAVRLPPPASPTVRAAPPYYPAPYWRVCPPASAEFRTARPPQVQPIAPI
eukprot:6846862-Prymnesium_polylepis.1